MTSLIAFATITVFLGSVIATPVFDGRIIGGLLAPEHTFPFLVGLSINKVGPENGTFWCGGSLIAPNYILTAAHCLYGGTTRINIKLGIHDRNCTPPPGDMIKVYQDSFTIHEKFDRRNVENDIALIKLPVNVTLTDDVKIIHLPSRYMDQEFLQGLTVTTAGWGRTHGNVTEISEDLRYVDVRIIGLENCEKYYDGGVITPKNICIDGSELKGTCNGDSGGPLIYQAVDETRYLVGLTSFGSDHGCEKGYPAAFTRITSFLDWITEQTGIVSLYS